MAERALQYPPATHVHLEDGHVYRIDALTLKQARWVIIKLCDDLEIERHNRPENTIGRRPGWEKGRQ